MIQPGVRIESHTQQKLTALVPIGSCLVFTCQLLCTHTHVYMHISNIYVDTRKAQRAHFMVRHSHKVVPELLTSMHKCSKFIIMPRCFTLYTTMKQNEMTCTGELLDGDRLGLMCLKGKETLGTKRKQHKQSQGQSGDLPCRSLHVLATESNLVDCFLVLVYKNVFKLIKESL